MTDMELYAVPIPDGARSDAGSINQQQQSLAAILDGDTGDVQSIGSEPGERTLTVEYPDEYADVRATELRELAAGFDQPLAYHAQSGTSLNDRYVTASRADVSPIDPRGETSYQRSRVSLSDAGSIASDWREVRTDQAQVDHPFGTVQEAPVGIPAAATKVRWFNPTTGATATPTVQTTRTAQNGDVDIIDANAAPYTAPSVIFELDYLEDGWTDPRVWDARGFADIEDANGATQWQKVFATSHRFVGDAVLENGLIRLTVDEPNNSLTAERWDSGTSSWTSQSLGASDWELFDLDIRTVGLAQVGASVEFRDTTQSPTAYHSLTMQLPRGNEDPLWSTDSGVPTGLETLLDPIAAGYIYDPYGDLRSTPQGLRSKQEVN